AASERRAQRAERSAADSGVDVSTEGRTLGGEAAAVVIATAEDDVSSVVGRIDTADSPEVILIVRRDARAFRRGTAWPHVAAHVRRRGIELGVVAPRAEVRSHAKANGLKA